MIRDGPTNVKSTDELKEVERRQSEARDQPYQTNEAMDVSDVEELKRGREKPRPTSPLTSITPRSSSPAPTQTSTDYSIAMQHNNRRYDTRSFPNHLEPALRTRMDNRYPEPRPAKLAPAIRKPRRSPFDALDVATAVATAGMTHAMAKGIRTNAAGCTTTQLIGFAKELLATMTLNNALAVSNSDTIIEIPPFLPKITSISLPIIKPSAIHHDFDLSALLSQDMIMGDASAEANEGEAATEAVKGHSEEDGEQIHGEETSNDGERA